MPEQLANQETCWITHRDDLPKSEMTDWDDEPNEAGEDQTRKQACLSFYGNWGIS